MVRTNLLNEVSTSGRRRWLRVNELPWSRALTYSMLRAGVLQSILLTYPGCVKGLRLIDGDSLDRYLEGLAKREFTPSPCKRGRAGTSKEAMAPQGSIYRGMKKCLCAQSPDRRAYLSFTISGSYSIWPTPLARLIMGPSRPWSDRYLFSVFNDFQHPSTRFNTSTPFNFRN